jgi:hypothetical protein
MGEKSRPKWETISRLRLIRGALCSEKWIKGERSPQFSANNRISNISLRRSDMFYGNRNARPNFIYNVVS